jgi:ribonuclease HII
MNKYNYNYKMENSFIDDEIEAGIDEAGRGCLCGRVYTAAVILPEEYEDDTYLEIKDSKKLSRKKRDELRRYIETVALDYSVAYADEKEVDKHNILQATIRSMHRSLDNLNIVPGNIVVDGSYFKMYKDTDNMIIPHQLITNGDNKYRNIAAASILAKTYHDEYIDNLLEKEPDLEKYGWRTNMGYGTKKHMEALKKYGPCKYHRKSFKPCQ